MPSTTASTDRPDAALAALITGKMTRGTTFAAALRDVQEAEPGTNAAKIYAAYTSWRPIAERTGEAKADALDALRRSIEVDAHLRAEAKKAHKGELLAKSVDQFQAGHPEQAAATRRHRDALAEIHAQLDETTATMQGKIADQASAKLAAATVEVLAAHPDWSVERARTHLRETRPDLEDAYRSAKDYAKRFRTEAKASAEALRKQGQR